MQNMTENSQMTPKAVNFITTYINDVSKKLLQGNFINTCIVVNFVLNGLLGLFILMLSFRIPHIATLNQLRQVIS